MSSPTRPQIREALRTLVADKRYRDHNHPEHDAYVAHVTGEFKRVYPGPYVPGSSHMYANDPEGGPEAIVHVRAYSQSRDGNVVQVSDYDRAAPGTGAAQHGDAKLSAAKGTKSPIPKPIIRDDSKGGGYFGDGRKGEDGKRYEHQGVDIEAAPGTSVSSPVDGTVDVRLAYKKQVFNDEYKAVTVTDKEGREFIFRYVMPSDPNGQVIVKKGDKVKVGQPIGSVQDRARKDESGKMKNHVHVEIKENGHITNPTKVIQDWQKQ